MQIKLIKILWITIIIWFPSNSFAQVWATQQSNLSSRWAKEVSPTNSLIEYPRPQLVRNNWQNLNGIWEFSITKRNADQPQTFPGKILVPFPIESALSGVKKQLKPNDILWYRKIITLQKLSNKRTLLHFGAVDWEATVFVNGIIVGTHKGGYTNFTIDITESLKNVNNEIIVKVADPTDKGIGPHGKQVISPENIYYTSSSGIWQTVWLETVPETYIEDLKLTPDVDKGLLNFSLKIGNIKTNVEVEAISYDRGRAIANWHSVHSGEMLGTLRLANAHLWSPSNPFLYDLVIRLKQNGKVIDEVKSYFGMRKIGVAKDTKGIDRICLNNKPYFNFGILDQGFWPEGLYTAPTDEALAFDIKAIKAMGFNTIRKHIKVEPARWYYWADKLGILVWQDMVNPNQALPEGSKKEFETESKEILGQLHNSPCIVTWVLFNEKWGQYDQARLTKWLKDSDPSRIVNGHSGEYLYVDQHLRSPSPDAYINADLTDVHSYPDPMMPLKLAGKAQVLGEFGGTSESVPGHEWSPSTSWGYTAVKRGGLKTKYAAQVKQLVLLKKQGLSGSIYTQPFDVEGEANGLVTYDREVAKIPFEDIRKINQELSGILPAKEKLPMQVNGQTDFDNKYAAALKVYKAGKPTRDFLRSAIMLADMAKDSLNLFRLLKDYLSYQHKPFDEGEITFIAKYIISSKSPAFAFFIENRSTIDQLMGANYTDLQLQAPIFNEEIAHYVQDPKGKPDWDEIEKKVTKYGLPGEQIFLRAKFIHLFNQRDWANFAPVLVKHDQLFPAFFDRFDFNNYAWELFSHVDDPEILKIALGWSKRVVESPDHKIPEFEPGYIDTYANLLYKLGNRRAAIEWERKAVKLSNDRQEFVETLKRMEQQTN